MDKIKEETMEKIRCEACNRDFIDQEALASHNAAKHGIKHNLDNSAPQPKNKGDIYKVLTFMLIIGIVVAWFLFSGHAGSSIGGNSISGSSGSAIQKITLGFNRGYTPNTIRVKANEPVEITLDNSVGGCFRSFNIRDLGVSDYSQSPSQTIKFTPTQKGSFEFACGMGMAKGTIIVE